MQRSASLLGLLVLAIGGCSSMNNTEAGALGGGVIGAGVGTIIGAATRHPLIGAAAGAAVGSGVGALAGHSEDRREQKVAQAAAARALRLDDVVRLHQSGQSDQVIMQQIYTTGSVYQLSPPELDYLKANGISDPVIMYMQSRSPGAVGLPVGAPAGAVYIAPPPPPPVGVGFTFVGGGPCRRW